MCEGLITRIKCTKNRTEKAILDFFIVCHKVRPFIEKMVIDESRQHVLTNFNPIRRGGKAIESNHNRELLKLSLEYHPRKAERIEMFNFKNVECQKVFQNLTSQTLKFTECFENNFNLKDQALKWNKTLNSFCHQSFKKVRITPNVPKITKVTELM